MGIQHTLLYFSGVSDDSGMGGKPLTIPHGQEVLTEMESLPLTGDDEKIVQGFGGTLAKGKDLVTAALKWVEKNHDARGKLIIYGYSAGGINGLDLCRALKAQSRDVTLLIAVDVSTRASWGTVINPFADYPHVDRTVPSNVKRTRNYYQTDDGPLSLSHAKSGPLRGQHVHNINCDDFSFDNTVVSGKSRHAQMQDVTRHKVRQDLVIELHRN